MTTYLVDFENVKSDGLNGIANLSEQERVVIFYSVNADKITFDLHNKINKSIATIDFYKVEVGHKNALDFQLASYLGFLLANDKQNNYVIVSNDAGYSPLISFWTKLGYKVKLTSDLKKIVKVENQPQITNEQPKLIVSEQIEQITLNQQENVEAKSEESSEIVEEAINVIETEKAIEVASEEILEAKPIKNNKRNNKQNNGRAKKNNTKGKESVKEAIVVVDADETTNSLLEQISKIVEEKEEAKLLSEYIQKYKTKQGLNNAIVKVYGTTKGGNLYKLIKPFILDKKGK